MKQIPLIYILSNGRSGSTLLDLLLGMHPAIWTVGEAQILPWELRENRRPCGCGRTISSCDFWRPILPQIPLDEGNYPIEYFRERHNAGKVLRWSRLREMRRPHLSVEEEAAVQQYGDLNHAYLSVVWQAAQQRRSGPIRYLVDASKDPYRLYWLLRHGAFDIRIIHLIKDPRAFVYSMTKNDLHSPARKTRFAGRWLVENGIFSYLCADPALAGRIKRVRYEAMAREPDELLAQLGDWLGLTFDSVNPARFREQENHGVSGNPMRWRDTEIELDQKWRSGMSKTAASLIWILTSPLAVRFGYRRVT